MEASRRVKGSRPGLWPPHHIPKAQGPDSPDIAPPFPPKGVSISSDNQVEWPL